MQILRMPARSRCRAARRRPPESPAPYAGLPDRARHGATPRATALRAAHLRRSPAATLRGPDGSFFAVSLKRVAQPSQSETYPRLHGSKWQLQLFGNRRMSLVLEEGFLDDNQLVG